jgi:type I restriction enzyme, S subunit
MKMASETEFKQTEIGMIPEDWEIKPIGDVFTLSQGLQIAKSLRSPMKANGAVPLLKITELPTGNFTEFVSDVRPQHLANKDDIIYTRTGQVGLVYTNYEGCVHNNCFKIHYDNTQFDKMFVFYLLKQKRVYDYANSVAGGSVQKDLSHPAFKSCIIAFPSLAEQQAIGRILANLDFKITLNQQLNETLEAIGKAIFKHWFIDFEFPNNEGKPYKSSGGEMIYSKERRKEIPKGWETKPIDEIAEFLNGLALQKYAPENEMDVLPVIKIRELRQGITESTDRASSNIPKEYVVDDGDILFSWSGSLEAIIWTSGKGALNQHLFKVTSAAFPKWFYYHWVLQHLPEYRRIAEGKATTMGHIQRHHLKSSLVLVPDEDALRRMDKIQNPIFEKLVQIGVESRNLSQIRDMLLPKLMSGKISVAVEVR